jgi:hypothetical protein
MGFGDERAVEPKLRSIRDDLAHGWVVRALSDTVWPNASQLPWLSCARAGTAAAPVEGSGQHGREHDLPAHRYPRRSSERRHPLDGDLMPDLGRWLEHRSTPFAR